MTSLFPVQDCHDLFFHVSISNMIIPIGISEGQRGAYGRNTSGFIWRPMWWQGNRAVRVLSREHLCLNEARPPPNAFQVSVSGLEWGATTTDSSEISAIVTILQHVNDLPHIPTAGGGG